MTIGITPIPAVEMRDGKPIVSSLKVAEHFGRNHFNVVRDIRNLLGNLPPEFNASNFEAVEYVDAKGEKRPAFDLSRDAFTLLAMGFTGRDALAWKLRYIQAFNAMEAELSRRAADSGELTRKAYALAEARYAEGMRRAMEVLARCKPASVAVYVALARYANLGLTPAECAKLLGRKRSTTTGDICRLRRLGLIATAPQPCNLTAFNAARRGLEA